MPAQEKRMYRREKLSVTRLKKHRHKTGRRAVPKGETKSISTRKAGQAWKKGGWAAVIVLRKSVAEPSGRWFRTRGDRYPGLTQTAKR